MKRAVPAGQRTSPTPTWTPLVALLAACYGTVEGSAAPAADSGAAPAACSGVTCSGHGTCEVRDDAAVCLCEAGYRAAGLECLADDDPCASVTCSDHGRCTTSADAVSCTCDAGYHAEGLACVADDDTLSAGCGKPGAPTGRWPGSTIDASGIERRYILYVPDDYDPNQPHALVWQFHPWGWDGASIESSLPLRDYAEGKAIFVYPDGLEQYKPEVGVEGGTGWDWAADDNNDLVLFDLLNQQLENDYCIDTARIFTTGFSYGGHHSHTLACYRGDVVRATAPIAGDNYADPSRCTAEVPSFMSVTGTQDFNVSQDRAKAALAYWVGRLGCDGETTSVTGVPQCEEAQLCPSDKRVLGCWNYDEGHWVPNGWQPVPVAQAIWAFFDGFQ